MIKYDTITKRTERKYSHIHIILIFLLDHYFLKRHNSLFSFILKYLDVVLKKIKVILIYIV